MKKKSILIWNITFILDSTLANAGDKALLESIVSNLRYSMGSFPHEISMLVDKKDFIESNYPAITCFETHGMVNKFRLPFYIRKCDYFIYGGGEGFQNVSSSIFLLLNLSLGFLALSMRKKIILLSSGLGRNFELVGLGKALSRILLTRAKVITVRDQGSLKSIRELQVNEKKVTVGADPALLIPPRTLSKKRAYVCIAPRLLHCLTNKNVREKLLSVLPIETRIKLRLVPERFWRYKDKLVSDLADLVRFCLDELNLDVVLLPMYAGRISPKDDVFCEEIAKKVGQSRRVTVAKSDLPIAEISTIIGESKVVVSMPLHALILASTYSVPIVAINYQTKGQRFMDSIGQEKYSFYLRDIFQPFPQQDIKASIRHCLKNREVIARDIRDQVAREKVKARANFKIVSDYIKEDAKK